MDNNDISTMKLSAVKKPVVVKYFTLNLFKANVPRISGMLRILQTSEIAKSLDTWKSFFKTRGGLKQGEGNTQ